MSSFDCLAIPLEQHFREMMQYLGVCEEFELIQGTEHLTLTFFMIDVQHFGVIIKLQKL